MKLNVLLNVIIPRNIHADHFSEYLMIFIRHKALVGKLEYKEKEDKEL